MSRFNKKVAALIERGHRTREGLPRQLPYTAPAIDAEWAASRYGKTDHVTRDGEYMPFMFRKPRSQKKRRLIARRSR